MTRILNVPETHRIYKRTAAVGRPETSVGELGDIPHNLVHDLRELHGVGRGTRATAIGTTSLGAVGNMTLMVRTVEVDAVPAAIEEIESVKASSKDHLLKYK